MSDIINLPENASKADFASFVTADEAFGTIGTTEAGKRYIEALPGQFSEGQAVVRFVQVYEGTGRRSSWKFVGFRKEVVGTICGAGKVFTRGIEGIDHEVTSHQRFYIEG